MTKQRNSSGARMEDNNTTKGTEGSIPKVGKARRPAVTLGFVQESHRTQESWDISAMF